MNCFYVPTPHELERIKFLRREIAELEQMLQRRRDDLADYHKSISADFEQQLRLKRGDR